VRAGGAQGQRPGGAARCPPGQRGVPGARREGAGRGRLHGADGRQGVRVTSAGATGARYRRRRPWPPAGRRG
jgi:hypothetical protein